MSYETVILELLTRIKNLENEVEAIKQQLNIAAAITSDGENGGIASNAAATQYTKMTDEMIEICYRCGKKVHQGENLQELADDIAAETGMNRNSAIMYLYAVSGMLSGTIYKRSISGKALKIYLNKIFNEFGSAGLKRAIKATRLHIDYRRDCGHTVDSIEKICDEFESSL